MDKGLEKNITIADVAEALGVSKTTVSRAISGKGRIGRETRERVLAYIEEHDYKPNVIAKSMLHPQNDPTFHRLKTHTHRACSPQIPLLPLYCTAAGSRL